MSALLVAVGILLAIVLAIVGIIWLLERSTDTRPRYQYVEVEWTDATGKQWSTEGWCSAVYYPRGMTLALDWANKEERTEIGAQRLNKVERGEWKVAENIDDPNFNL